jgi:hypothetical protein
MCCAAGPAAYRSHCWRTVNALSYLCYPCGAQVSAALGGKVKIAASGAAPLPLQVHDHLLATGALEWSCKQALFIWVSDALPCPALLLQLEEFIRTTMCAYAGQGYG